MITVAFSRELEISLIFWDALSLSPFMIRFFNSELLVGIKVHGQVVLVTLNAQIEPVKKDALPLAKDAN